MCNPFCNTVYIVRSVWNQKIDNIILSHTTHKMYFGVCDLRKLYVRSNHLIKKLKMTSYRRFKPRSFNRPWDTVWCEMCGLLNKNPSFQNQKFQIGSEVTSYTFFFKEPVKFRRGLKFLFFKAFQPHNVLILF